MSNRSSDFTQWIVLFIVAILLGGLLFIKMTGRQDIFSYQGVTSDTPGLRSYLSGIGSINTWLQGGDAVGLLQEGIQSLQDAYGTTRNKELLTLLSGEINKAKSIDIIQTTTACFDMLQSGFVAIRGIMSEYETLTSGFQSINSDFEEVVTLLPASATKQCLTEYRDNLKGSVDSLMLTYKNIDIISKQYDTEVVSYTKKLGGCASWKETFDRMSALHEKLKTVNAAIANVQKHLDSNAIAKYNELCAYGTIKGLTGLQTESRKLVQSLGSVTTDSLQQVDNVDDYVQQLREQVQNLTGSSVSRWQRFLAPYIDVNNDTK